MKQEDLINLPCLNCKYFKYIDKFGNIYFVKCKKTYYGRGLHDLFVCGQFKPKRKYKNEC